MEKSKKNKVNESPTGLHLSTSPLRRVVAAFFDLVIIVAGSMVLMVPAILVYTEAIIGPTSWRTTALWIATSVTGALIVILDIVFRVVFLYKNHGQTVGYRYLNIQLVSENGDELKLEQILVHSITIVFLSVLTFGIYYIVELISFFITSSHRGFVDIVSHTIVTDAEAVSTNETNNITGGTN